MYVLGTYLGKEPCRVSELGFPLSETKPSLLSLSPLLTHRLYLHSKLRFSTHGWPSTLHLLVCSPTPTQSMPNTLSPLTTPSPPSSIHSWMVRTCLLLMQRILPNPPPTIHYPLSKSTPPASFLHPSSTSINLHPKQGVTIHGQWPCIVYNHMAFLPIS